MKTLHMYMYNNVYIYMLTLYIYMHLTYVIVKGLGSLRQDP